MFAFKRSINTLVLLSKSRQNQTKYLFADAWKDRQNTQQKIYVTQQQKEIMKKLVEKFQNQEMDSESNAQQFERRLNTSMQRYKIDNPNLAQQILNLHLTMTYGN